MFTPKGKLNFAKKIEIRNPAFECIQGLVIELS